MERCKEASCQYTPVRHLTTLQAMAVHNRYSGHRCRDVKSAGTQAFVQYCLPHIQPQNFIVAQTCPTLGSGGSRWLCLCL